MTIQNWRQYMTAQERRGALAGCLEDTAEERELIAVQLAIKVWETKHRISTRL